MGSVSTGLVSGARARAAIAAFVEDSHATSMRIGNVDLQSHQVSAAYRLRKAIDEFGGALLCDPVGTGKTYVALAISQIDEAVLVVAPAVLRKMWMRASAIAERHVDFVSFESLSRRSAPIGRYALLIVDEAHHVRNPRTIRYEILSRLCTGKDVLMLTATPIHNRRIDLDSLLALFIGSRAAALTPAEIGRCVIRRAELTRELTSIPHADEVVWCRIAEDDRIPAALLDLPPPLPPRDGADGGALIVHSLVHQWSSSDAALIAGLRRRLARAEALIAAIGDGTWPSKSELSAWIAGEDAVQLALPALLAPLSEKSGSLLPIVERHRDALKATLGLARLSISDQNRAAVIRRIRESHSDQKIVVFSQYADSVEGMFALLSRDGYVAALTGAGARVAGGAIARHAAIERFAPLASGISPPRKANDVTLLITTDLLSEGVNLQDAGVVIHLDLPWTPARLEQRLGRIARLGSMHEKVTSYAFKPAASSEAIIRTERILARKLQAAGVIAETLPSFGEWSSSISMSDNSPLTVESLRSIFMKWKSSAPPDASLGPVTAAVRSDHEGFLAVVKSRQDVRLVGCIGKSVSDDIGHILHCTERCMADDCCCSSDDITRAETTLHQWLVSERALYGTRLSSVAASSARNNAVRRIDHAVRSAPLHQRAQLQQKAHRARAILDRNFGIHAEEELARVCRSSDRGEVWLDRVIAFGTDVSDRHAARLDQNHETLALICFVA